MESSWQTREHHTSSSELDVSSLLPSLDTSGAGVFDRLPLEIEKSKLEHPQLTSMWWYALLVRH